MKVFIVEDELFMHDLYRIIFKLANLEILGFATNGEEAIQMFKNFKEKPDVILMDHRMPIKNGLNTTKEILEIDKEVIIIFTSADISIKKEALSAGAFDFLEKPFSFEFLINLLNKLNETNSKNKNILGTTNNS